MILQALVHLYDELCKQGKIAEEGWGIAKVSHRIVLDEAGHLQGIVSAKKKVQRGKKEIEVPSEMIVPIPAERSGKIKKSSFLCDNGKYFLGIDPAGEADKETLKKYFEAAQKLHHEILDNCNSPVAKGILRFFDAWDLCNTEENSIIKENRKDLSKSSGFIFQVSGKDALQSKEMRDAWNEYYQGRKGNGDKAHGACLVTGLKKQPISRLHPMIKGVVGTDKNRGKLVSFNSTSFCSYGYDGMQGKNAPVSERAAFAYGAALNHLLADKAHVKQMGDITVVYWSEHAIDACQDCFMSFWSDDASGMDDSTLDNIMEKMRNGLPASLKGIEISPDEPFYILGLSPNAARISVRFFLRNTFGETMAHMVAHQERLTLSGPAWESGKIPLWKLIKAAENPSSDKSGSSPLLAGSLMRSVLQDSSYPEALFQHVMMRIFADQDKTDDKGQITSYKISHARAAFIKAYLLKNRVQHWEGQIQMAVNENCTSIAYVLGRLFSVLENVQEKANPSINATIKDRYFNGACATPAVVFPTLLKLSNAHLGKLEVKQTAYFNKKLGALMEKIPMPDMGVPFPARLSLEEQGAFVLGYYQETQSRYKKKEDK